MEFGPEHGPHDTGEDDTLGRPRRGIPLEDQPTQAITDQPARAAGASPRVLGHRYELGEVIGRGGMAEVRRAYDTRLGREVAVKELRVDLASDPTFQARFRREAQSSAGLNHPNIVAVYDTGEEPDERAGVAVPYIVMELVDGHTLRDVLREGRKILPERALELTQGVLDALGYSHRAGIIHRDIKPANVMLTSQGQVKVMDFGIARAVADTSNSMTQTAAVIGTAQYLSPEQARGEAVDNRSDVYSAGCLLYELLLGRPPFQGDSPVAVAYQHVRELPVPPSQLDSLITPEMDAIVLKALAKDPDERYQSARDMRDDIARLLAGQEITASVPAVTGVASFGEPTGENRTVAAPVAPAVVEEEVEDEPEERRRPWAWIAALVLATLLLVGGAAWWFLHQPAAAPAGPVQVSVPRVQGNTRVSAENRIRDAQLKPVVDETQGPDDQTVGTVVQQSPEGGTSVTVGSDVHVTVNVGPRKVQVPAGLVGKNKDEARRTLEQAGFTAVELVAADNEPATASADDVTAVNPGEGTSVAASSKVTLTYATGKSALPNWQGLNRAAVEREAKQLGFTNVVFEEADTNDPGRVGVVVNTRPQSGTQVDRSARIVVYIGKAAAVAPAPRPTTSAPQPTPTRSTAAPTPSSTPVVTPSTTATPA